MKSGLNKIDGLAPIHVKTDTIVFSADEQMFDEIWQTQNGVDTVNVWVRVK